MSRAGPVAIVVLAAAAAGHVLLDLHLRGGVPAGDIYGYFLPNVLHAVDAVRHGGRGLLWNPFQTCGAPFFGNGATGLLYPLHWLFLVLEPNAAVHAVQAANMLIGAAGMLLYARRLGATPMAALAGALVFELGDPMSEFTRWSPMHCGPWAWIPWAMLCCERLLDAEDGRTRRSGVALVVVLALQLLPGFPLIAVLTQQLVALRVAWELVTRPIAAAWRGALAVAAALLAAPLLAAVQVLPMAEFARESLRGNLGTTEMLSTDLMGVSQLLAHTAQRMPPLPFLVAPLAIVPLAPLRPSTRRMAAFFLLVGATYAVLGLGKLTPLFDWYVRIPPGAATLRFAFRLFWITGFCLAPLTALGLDALRDGLRRRWGALAAVGALAVVLAVLVPGGLRPSERVALVAVVAAVVATSLPGLPRPGTRCIVLAAIICNLIAVPISYRGRLLRSLDALRRHAPLFAALEPSPQDRVLIIPDASAAVSFELMEKTSTVLRVPGLFDYEALYGRRFAEYFTMLRRGTADATLIDLYWPAPLLTDGVRRRLVDAAAVRWVIASASVDGTARRLGLPPVAVADPGVRVYRNDDRLPRARFVPRVEVMPDPDALLRRLADGDDDLARVALVEAPPASGAGGPAAAGATGTARFVADDPEHVVLDVDAPAAGFVVLADQYYPGWRASVDGHPVPIARGNYLFRLVEVPAGRSRVDFRYRPASVYAGGLVSLLTAVGLAAAARRRRFVDNRRAVP